MNDQKFFEKFGVVFLADKNVDTTPIYKGKLMENAVAGPASATELDYQALDKALEMAYEPMDGLQNHSRNWGILIDGQFHRAFVRNPDGFDHSVVRGTDARMKLEEEIFLAVKAGKLVESRRLTDDDLEILEIYRTEFPSQVDGLTVSVSFDPNTGKVIVHGIGYHGMPWNVRPAGKNQYDSPEEFAQALRETSELATYVRQIRWFVQNSYLDIEDVSVTPWKGEPVPFDSVANYMHPDFDFAELRQFQKAHQGHWEAAAKTEKGSMDNMDRFVCDCEGVK